MNVVSRLAVLSLCAVGMAGADAAAEGAREPLVEHVRAANDRFATWRWRWPRATRRSPAPAASTAARWASTTSTTYLNDEALDISNRKR